MNSPQHPYEPFPIITVTNASLLPLAKSDGPELYLLRSDTLVNKYTGIQKPENLESVEKFIEQLNLNIQNKESIIWKIALPDTTTLIGTICLWNFNKINNSAEIGFVLLPDFWRRGIMRNAVKAVMQFALNQLQLTTVEAWTHSQNIASIQLLLQADFKRDTNLELAANFTPEEKELQIYVYHRPL